MNEAIEFDIKVNGKNAKLTIQGVEDAQEKLSDTTAKTTAQMIKSWVKVGATVYGVKKAFDFARDIDALETRMSVALGTTEGMVEKFGELRKFADNLGLSFESMASSYVNFKVASDLANTSVEDTEKIFKSVATAGAAMKLSTDDMNGIFRALQQMMSKGTVQAEELRGQLGERLPGAFSLAAKSMGMTTMELGKMMEKGELLASDLLPKLADELNNKFADGAVKSAKSIQASYNRLGNAFTDFKGIVLNVLQNVGIIEYFSDAIGVVNNFTRSMLHLTKGVKELSEAERKADRAKQLQIIADKEADILRIKGNYLFTSTVAEKQAIRAAKRRIAALDAEDTAAKKAITQQETKLKKEQELADAQAKAAEQRKGIEKFDEAHFKATTTRQEQQLKALDIEYQEYSKYTTDKLKLDEWYAAAKQKIIESNTKKTGKSELEKEAKKAQRVNEQFWDDYKQSAMTAMEYELSLLNDQYNEYNEHVENKAALDEWYAAEQKRIMDENNFQMQAYADMQMAVTDDMADALIRFAETGKLSFSDMAKSIISDLARIQIRASMSSLMSGLFSGGGDMISGMFAKGAAFNNGNVTAFAQGGVVGSPTVFPMANGMGLMGEAGSEVIAPLKRDAKGNMGVGAIAPVVNVSVQNYGNDNVKVEQSGDNIQVIISQIASSISRGTGDVGKAIESRYGIRKA